MAPLRAIADMFVVIYAAAIIFSSRLALRWLLIFRRRFAMTPPLSPLCADVC